jgi:hypothetical protein
LVTFSGFVSGFASGVRPEKIQHRGLFSFKAARKRVYAVQPAPAPQLHRHCAHDEGRTRIGFEEQRFPAAVHDRTVEVASERIERHLEIAILP